MLHDSAVTSLLMPFLYNHDNLPVVKATPGRIICRLPAGHGYPKELVLKLYLHNTVCDRLLALFARKGGGRDLHVARQLKKAGISVPDPVGSVADVSWPIPPRQTLFASAWISDAKTLAFLLKSMRTGQKASPGRLHALGCAIGLFIASIHRNAIFPKDLNAGNILVCEARPNDFTLFLIDYEYIRFHRDINAVRALVNLSQIGVFLLPFGNGVLEAVSEAYCRANTRFKMENFSESVIRESNSRAARWQESIDARFDEIADAMESRNKVLGRKSS